MRVHVVDLQKLNKALKPMKLAFDDETQSLVALEPEKPPVVRPVLEWDDKRYIACVELLRKEGAISHSMMRKRLGIGGNSSARIMKKLEQEGLIGPVFPSRTGRPRELIG